MMKKIFPTKMKLILNTEEIVVYNTSENIVVRNTLFSKCKELRIEKGNMCIFTRCSFPICEKIYIKASLATGPCFYYCIFNENIRNETLQMKCTYITNQKNVAEKFDNEEEKLNIQEIQDIVNSYSDSEHKYCNLQLEKKDEFVRRKRNGEVCVMSTILNLWSMFTS